MLLALLYIKRKEEKKIKGVASESGIDAESTLWCKDQRKALWLGSRLFLQQQRAEEHEGDVRAAGAGRCCSPAVLRWSHLIKHAASETPQRLLQKGNDSLRDP